MFDNKYMTINCFCPTCDSEQQFTPAGIIYEYGIKCNECHTIVVLRRAEIPAKVRWAIWNEHIPGQTDLFDKQLTLFGG